MEKGHKKLELRGDHYYMQSGWKGAMGKFLDLDWIPRYMVVDDKGKIVVYRAIKTKDKPKKTLKMRKQIVAGNWKMNNDHVDSELLISKLLEQHHHPSTEVIVAPPFTNILAVTNSLKGNSIAVAAQNMHYAEHGAFTGEVSASMLTALGCPHRYFGPQ